MTVLLAQLDTASFPGSNVQTAPQTQAQHRRSVGPSVKCVLQ